MNGRIRKAGVKQAVWIVIAGLFGLAGAFVLALWYRDVLFGLYAGFGALLCLGGGLVLLIRATRSHEPD